MERILQEHLIGGKPVQDYVVYENKDFIVVTPFAPHITEELWHELGNSDSIHRANWPTYDETKIETQDVIMAVQLNGKTRATITVPRYIEEAEAVSIAMKNQKVERLLTQAPRRIVFVPGKIVNFIV